MRRTHLPFVRSLALLAPAALLWSAPRPAEACGGTFCDGGPNAMPVDQTGENILFVMNEGYTEAHIQIQYDPNTEAENFAWVVPVTVVPEFAVGSQPFFDNVLAGTVPTYGFNSTFDDCGFGDADDGGGDGAAGDEGGVKFDAAGGDGGPSVVAQETVGAFEIVVLSGGTAAEVMTWLGDNGFQQDPAAEPLLAEYLAEGLMFAAFKLKVGAETSEIHPVVLRFADSAEACIPIRLTRIAAVDDMHVRAFFLSDDRVVPQNYRHVLVNPLKIDWPNLAGNYDEVVTLAVDADGADGHAFVTEYAGPSDVVSTQGLVDPDLDPSAFAALDPVAAMQTLATQGWMSCAYDPCVYANPLVEGIVTQYLPPPDGVSMMEWSQCPRCYIDQFDATAWNAPAFVATLEERIIAPGQHAKDVIEAYPYLTRMFTTISPGEMTEDPLFHQNASLPEVVAFRTATRRQLCNGDSLWTLPDGREVYVPVSEPWPDFDDEMPWEEEIAEVPAAGPQMVLVDRTDEIDTLLAAYNEAHGWPGAGGGSGSGVDGGDTDDGTGGPDDPSAVHEDRDGGGCSCRAGSGTGWAVLPWLLAAIPFVRRRRDV